MRDGISRRSMLKMAASAAAAAPAAKWVFALTDGSRIVKAAADSETWTPVFLNDSQGEQLALLVDTLIPRTDSPGARDVRAHEYIDLELSIESESAQKKYVDGLAWLDVRAQEKFGHLLVEATDAERTELLQEISDENESVADELRDAASFFRDLKNRTIFAYYTSREARVEELGLPAHMGMQQWQGCTHAEH